MPCPWLNNYPRDKYNVLIPVTSMQVMSNMQRIIVNEVRLNTDRSVSPRAFPRHPGILRKHPARTVLPVRLPGGCPRSKSVLQITLP